jgi:hypothetical protein
LNSATNKPIAREVRSYVDTIDMFKTGIARRFQAKTDMNNESSRSHTVFTLYIKKRPRAERSLAEGTPTALEGRLVICDLAGSERIKKTDAKGQQLNEANHINGSLLVLGRVVAALTDPKQAQHVPYRESLLTRLLQYSLSGWGKTRLVVNVSPSDDNTDETIGAINFGQRAIQIKQAAEKHETLDYKAMYLDLQRQMDKQREVIIRDAMSDFALEKANAVADYEDRVKMLEGEIDILRIEIAQKDDYIAQLNQAAASGTQVAVVQGVTTPARPRAATITSNSGPTFEAPHEGGSFSLSPNASSIIEGAKVEDVLLIMKRSMANRDQRLNEMTELNHKLKEQIRIKEQELLLVASKLRTSRIVADKDKLYYEKVIAELSEKLAGAQGVDFLNANSAQPEEDEEPLQSSSPDDATASPGSSNINLNDEGNDRLWQAIRVLQIKLNDANAYNRTARRAIKMLVYDLDQARVGK